LWLCFYDFCRDSLFVLDVLDVAVGGGFSSIEGAGRFWAVSFKHSGEIVKKAKERAPNVCLSNRSSTITV